MLDIFSEFATDESLETQGVWVTLRPAIPATKTTPEIPATRLKVARANNRAYGKELSAVMEENSEALRPDDDASDRLSETLLSKVMAKTILLDWENVGYQGKPLPYSRENAEKLLAHKDFRIKVMELANKRDAFKAKEESEQGEA